METIKTAYVLTRRVSPSGMTTTLKGHNQSVQVFKQMQMLMIEKYGDFYLMALITSRLNAPEPMIRLVGEVFQIIFWEVLRIIFWGGVADYFFEEM